MKIPLLQTPGMILRRFLITLFSYLRAGVLALHRRIPKAFYYSSGAILFAAVLIVWVFSSRSQKPSFPALEPGKYVGLLEIPDIPKLAGVTLYVERRAREQSLQVVVFREGWKVQTPGLFLQEGETLMDKPSRFLPLELHFDEATLKLSGRSTGKEYRGVVSQNSQLRGTWKLRALSQTEIHRATPPQTNSDWLQQKAIHRLRLHEIAQLNERNQALRQELETLERFENDTTPLQALRREQAQTLSETLASLRQTQEQYALRVTELVRELNQLERITKIGQVVSLARRVSNREEKWYSVNWSDSQTVAADEQLVAEEMGVNIRTLTQELEQAREVQDLKKQIANEQAAIRKLEAEFQRRKEQGLRQKEQQRQEDSPQQAPPEREGPWWRRLDTVFGLVAGMER